LAGLGQLGGFLIGVLQLEKSLKPLEFMGELSQLLHICQTGIWEDPAKIMTSVPVKV
jgi:hypothetical protein